MASHIHLVFSAPPESVPAEEFNRWYDAHLEEILAVEGWESATRYRIEGVVGADQTGGYTFLSVYELSCPPEEAVANLERAGMGDADSYAEGKAGGGGRLPLPPWFSEIRFGSWNCIQVGETVRAGGARVE